MRSFGSCVAGLLAAAGLLGAAQAGAVTTAGPGAVVNTPAARVTEINSVIARIDAKQGILVAAGRTYRFDPATVSFADERREPPSGGLASLKAGSKVTLRATVQDGTERLLQIIARD
jgi:hypothetical protein